MKTTKARRCQLTTTMMIVVLCLVLSSSGMLVYVPVAHAEDARSWTQLPLYGGADSLAIDPKTPTTLYCVAQPGAYRSVDGGKSWTCFADISVAESMGRLFIDPVDPSTIYISTEYDGIIRTKDAGGHWTYVNTGFTQSHDVQSLVIDPQTHTTLYTSTSYGVFRSRDSGDHWIAVNTGLSFSQPPGVESSGVGIHTLAIDPLTPTTLYAGSLYGGVSRSVDSGDHWTAVNNGIPSHVSADNNVLCREIDYVSINPKTPTTLYVCTGDDGLFRSTDSGAHWSLVNASVNGTFFQPLIFDPTAPNTLYLCTHSEIFRSVNGGSTLIPASAGITGNVSSFAIDPKNPSTLYASTSGGGVFRSMDSGSRWTPSSTGLSYADSAAMVISSHAPTIMYVGTTNGVLRSTDRGTTWTPKRIGGTWQGAACLAVDPFNSMILYAGSGTKVYRSMDAGDHWTGASSSLDPRMAIRYLAVDSIDHSTLYASNGHDVYRSTDNGDHWTAIDIELSEGNWVTCIVVHPTIKGMLYVGTELGGVFRSRDSGGHWATVNAGMATRPTIYSLAIDPVTTTIMYAGSNGCVYRSTDSGTNWKRMSMGHDYVSVYQLAIDPATPSTLYIGSNVDVFHSTDSGVTWSVVKSTIISRDVSTLTIDPLDPDTLFVGFVHNGVLRYGVTSESNAIIQLTIGSTTMFSNGKATSLEAAPVILNSRTFVPIRVVVEAVGGTIAWNASVQKVTIVRKSKTLELWIGKNVAKLNGKSVNVDSNAKVVPIIKNGRTILPLRFVAESLDLDVQWDSATQTITITYTP